jgi:plasmid stabilization system protein ParE
VSLPVAMRAEATQDAEDARDYYEDKRVGLGQKSLDRMNDGIAQIGFLPELFGVAWKNVRAVRIKKFPYVVYYRVFTDRVEVLAVIHGSRHPSEWQSRA